MTVSNDNKPSVTPKPPTAKKKERGKQVSISTINPLPITTNQYTLKDTTHTNTTTNNYSPNPNIPVKQNKDIPATNETINESQDDNGCIPATTKGSQCLDKTKQSKRLKCLEQKDDGIDVSAPYLETLAIPMTPKRNSKNSKKEETAIPLDTIEAQAHSLNSIIPSKTEEIAINSPEEDGMGILQELVKTEITENIILKKLNEGLEAKRGIVIKTGENTQAVEMVADMNTQHKYLETVLKLRGDTKAENAPTSFINLLQIVQGGK